MTKLSDLTPEISSAYHLYSIDLYLDNRFTRETLKIACHIVIFKGALILLKYTLKYLWMRSC